MTDLQKQIVEFRAKLRDFPDDIKKGDVITFPDNDNVFIVTRTPNKVKTFVGKSHSCEVKDKDGNRFWQFAFKGIIINGKPLD